MTRDVFGWFQMRARRWPAIFAVPLALLLAVGAAVPAPQAAAAPAFDPQAILAAASPAVAVIRGSIGMRPISGTAVVIDSQGLLLTAAHVVRRLGKVQVELPGMATLDATVVGYDATRDLAVLHVSPSTPLQALALADGSLSLGDTVAVIGAPEGHRGVITTGEVLATHVSRPGLAPEIFVRVSAPVRPGESGAPLLTNGGKVAGVVVAFSLDRSDGPSSLAVSAETIRTALPQLRAGARVDRAWIGIVAGGSPGPDSGAGSAIVQGVVPQSPAATAGLRPGDAVVEFEGTAIHTWDDLLTAVGQHQPGQSVRLVVLRDGQRMNVTVTLGARP